MNQLNFSIVLIIFISIAIPSCKKTDHSLTEKEELLISHGWHISVDIENGVYHELSAPWSLDDCWFFYPNHTFINSPGALLRPPGGGGYPEENSSGTWKLEDNETTLNWTTDKPFNYQLSYPVIIKSDTMIITIITPDVNRKLIYTNCN